MSVRTNGEQHTVEFQLRGKRVHRRLPVGATRQEAERIERNLKRSIFVENDLDFEDKDGAPAKRLLMVAEMLLQATGIQPRPGVYFLCNAGQLVYIGASTNVARRLAKHHSKTYDYAVMIQTTEEKMRAVESYLIGALRPPLNRMGTGR